MFPVCVWRGGGTYRGIPFPEKKSGSKRSTSQIITRQTEDYETLTTIES